MSTIKSKYLSAPINGPTVEPLVFQTNNTDRASVDNSGNLLMIGPTGLGYGTGAGGTATQATSKSTDVTLNKPTGRIVMNNSALAAGATATFVLNNSLIASADNIITTVNYSANYRVWAFSVGSGTCSIAVKNESAGSLSEAVTVNFVVIKGATS